MTFIRVVCNDSYIWYGNRNCFWVSFFGGRFKKKGLLL